jgi:hypothetical protein
MDRSYYSEKVLDFLVETDASILGKLGSAYNLQSLSLRQGYAWEDQIRLLKTSCKGLENAHIFFEFAIPRMGKRVDNVIVIGNHVLVIEFKVGSETYNQSSIDQVLDYALDLRNFHEGSHEVNLVPILVSTDADFVQCEIVNQFPVHKPILCNTDSLSMALSKIANLSRENKIDPINWVNSKYKPTPTIIEAAQALYRGHRVEDITRYEAGDTSLSSTTEKLNELIDETKLRGEKSISFVTGVPGAGKTLIGLNIINERKVISEDENAVFLSGNGPLVEVLREALARDRNKSSQEGDSPISIKDARREVSSSIQNVHHFRDEYLKSEVAPDERVALFDEAQRAWDEKQTTKFVKERYRDKEFEKSEPHCLIDYMNRHSDWCSIVCLVGGGQEINTGEAGIKEWFETLRKYFPEWKVYYSTEILGNENYVVEEELTSWVKTKGKGFKNLHLSVSVRSFRSERLSEFVEELLNLNIEKATNIYSQIKDRYPIVLTRQKKKYEAWLRARKNGSERMGVLVSLNAKRLRHHGIDAENAIRTQSGKDKIAHWFLDDEDDVRSSGFLEVPATEFAVQGLELDWACVAWGGDLSYSENGWEYQKFRGSKWINVGVEEARTYLKNTYRVLLTRARQGMVIYIPEGSDIDPTRSSDRYDGTFNYLKSAGFDII